MIVGSTTGGGSAIDLGFMKKLFLVGMLAAFGVCGCGTFNGAEESAVQNFEQGAEGRGHIVSPNPMGDSFGSYYE